LIRFIQKRKRLISRQNLLKERTFSPSLMSKRPSNNLFYILLSLLVLFGLYIFGSLLIEARDDETLEGSIQRTIEETHRKVL